MTGDDEHQLPLYLTLRGWRHLGDKRFRWTVPALEIAEARSLAERVRCRLKGTNATDQTSDQRDWVSYCFEGSLLRLLFQAHGNARRHLLLSVVVIGGGFITSGIAVAAGSGGQGSLTSWVVFAIGLLVALAGGVSQLFRPGHRAAECAALAAQLRNEGWALWNSQGEYEIADAKVRFGIFEQRVSAIRARADEPAFLADPPQGPDS